MGIIGDAFKKLFNFLNALFGGLFGVIWDGIQWVGKVIWEAVKWVGNVLWDVIKWIGSLLKKLFQNLLDVLIEFFKVIYALIDGLLYLLYMIGVLAVKLFLVIFEAAKVLWSLIVGFGHTLASLHYSPQGSSGNGYSDMIGRLFANLDVLQLDAIAYILLFMLWFITAISAIKLISSIRVGGD